MPRAIRPRRRRAIRRRPVRKFLRYRKRPRKNSNISTTVIRGVSVIPDRLFVKLKYSVVTTFSTIGVNDWVMRGNSLFDPELTGAGHQPRGFDEWSSLYSRYKVYKSSIHVSAVNNDTDINYIAVMPTVEPSLTGIIANPQDITECPYVRYRYMPAGDTGPSKSTIFNYSTTKSIRGERILDDDYSALTTANPVKLWYWHILCSAANESVAPNTTAQINMVYYCEFFRRKTLIRS